MSCGKVIVLPFRIVLYLTAHFCHNWKLWLRAQAFPTLSDQVLGKRLKELKSEGLVIGSDIPDTQPPQIEYKITSKGEELLEIILSLHRWGKKWKMSGNRFCEIS